MGGTSIWGDVGPGLGRNVGLWLGRVVSWLRRYKVGALWPGTDVVSWLHRHKVGVGRIREGRPEVAALAPCRAEVATLAPCQAT